MANNLGRKINTVADLLACARKFEGLEAAKGFYIELSPKIKLPK